ncbi:MAG TPA: DUF3014 domain-containing protein [Steroidobacteraceae bacterium]|nr:DUF3014 domain-containing protein [Steroidobacteraceae bacterium]
MISEKFTDKAIMWGAAAAVVVAAGVMYWFYGRPHQAAPAPEPLVGSAPAAPASSPPAIEHPVPAASAPAPLPALNDSDQAFHDALTALPGSQAVESLLVPEHLIRRIVTTVDNLPKKHVAVEQRPIKPTGGQFMTATSGDKLTIAPENYGRYKPFVDLVQGTDVHRLATVYFHFYPLFQQAYDDLGYGSGYFNDRVIALIDHLLATPDVQGPVELVQPNVMYLYADPALESLSPGQKTLIRMGPDNEAVIKKKLTELRAALVGQHP